MPSAIAIEKPLFQRNAKAQAKPVSTPHSGQQRNQACVLTGGCNAGGSEASGFGTDSTELVIDEFIPTDSIACEAGAEFASGRKRNRYCKLPFPKRVHFL
jgi:hypothetical protein